MQSKKEFLKAKAIEYKQLKKAENMAKELEKTISDIRAMGYKLIVLGSTVKITLGR